MNKILGFFKEYRFLSNFYAAEVEWEGKKYRSTEHAYQAAKSLDPIVRENIRNHPKFVDAKKLGGELDCRPDWEDVKIGVMEDVVRQKFTKHQDLKEMLLATGDAYLEETNYWHDCFWGVCTCNGPKCKTGANNLGKILMKIREEIKSSEAK